MPELNTILDYQGANHPNQDGSVLSAGQVRSEIDKKVPNPDDSPNNVFTYPRFVDASGSPDQIKDMNKGDSFLVIKPGMFLNQSLPLNDSYVCNSSYKGTPKSLQHFSHFLLQGKAASAYDINLGSERTCFVTPKALAESYYSSYFHGQYHLSDQKSSKGLNVGRLSQFLSTNEVWWKFFVDCISSNDNEKPTYTKSIISLRGTGDKKNPIEAFVFSLDQKKNEIDALGFNALDDSLDLCFRFPGKPKKNHHISVHYHLSYSRDAQLNKSKFFPNFVYLTKLPTNYTFISESDG